MADSLLLDLCPDGVVFELMVGGQYFPSEEKGIAEEQMMAISKQELAYDLRGRNKCQLPTEGAGKSPSIS